MTEGYGLHNNQKGIYERRQCRIGTVLEPYKTCSTAVCGIISWFSVRTGCERDFGEHLRRSLESSLGNIANTVSLTVRLGQCLNR